MRQCRVGGSLPTARHRILRRSRGFWINGADHGVRHRPRLGYHLNSAVSVGLVVGKRFLLSDLLPYIIVQLVGAVAASCRSPYGIASGKAGFTVSGGFASNG